MASLNKVGDLKAQIDDLRTQAETLAEKQAATIRKHLETLEQLRRDVRGEFVDEAALVLRVEVGEDRRQLRGAERGDEVGARAAVEAVRPGVTAEHIDAAARDVLAEEGLADAFVHRTGHGIGLSVHEEPYIVAGNALPLQEGMAFSVEPGVYFPGQWGARIEDIVIVTADGALSVNNRPHDLVVVPVS